MKHLTQTRLKELFHYDPGTGDLIRKIRVANCVQIGDIAGCKSGDGYLRVGINGKIYLAHRLAWLFTYGYLPEKDIDHINMIKSDNKICNLREVSRSCNMRNIGNKKNNTSGIKGVQWHKGRNKWEARVKVNQKKCFGGLYKSFDNAACARLALEQSLNWKGCDSSSPAFQYVQNMIRGL